MFFFGKLLDPQPASEVAIAAGIEPVADHHEGARGQGSGEHHDHRPPAPGARPAHGHHHESPLKKLIDFLCPGMVLLSFIFSAGAVYQLSQLPNRVHQVIQFTWVTGLPFHMANGHLATFQADWGFLLDPLSAVMILVVTGVGFLIHVYSTGYMAHDNGYYRFFGYLNLFVFFMLMLVLANNYMLLFVGWEGVGLCSYLLIGFYYHKKSAGDAGKKAFIVNRVGDSGFILGMLLMMSVLGTVKFTDVNALLRSGSFHPEVAGFGVLSAIAILMFVGATGKSAQVPLYVWLPDAMEGPTPVSALIHAATMVTAGVYMVARSAALFQLTPNASTVVAAVGAFTAILAATIALVQNDIKRVLAYSTVSQLGYMFLALGVGAYWVAIFHLFTHAFFKALLFLCSGSVIHAMGGEQDMRFMGALKKKIPITHWTMFVGSVAIAGIPGLAGFFSKDEILWQAYSSPQGSRLLWFVGLATAGLTAFYMWRLMNMTFYGKSRVAPEKLAHIHESPAPMTVPLTILAIGSVFAGWLGTPKLW
ncbi:MAG: NADH-quinone oxidoreductase subunit L, partial [Acidobacteriia bacterium]|nr:NADH-quinone oxidoreductase subunit L [Terriglobia bacterium]